MGLVSISVLEDECRCVDTFTWKLPDIKYDLRGEELEATLWGRTFPVQLRATEVMSC